MELLKGDGNVAYCGYSTCHIAGSTGFHYPNGLVKGQDGLYYIPSSWDGKIQIMELQSNRTLIEIATIRTGMPIDSLSVDEGGDIYAAPFPQFWKMVVNQDPYNVDVPSPVLRLRKSQNGTFEVKKILEDRRIVGGATIVRHDSKTGRLFIGGMFEARHSYP